MFPHESKSLINRHFFKILTFFILSAATLLLGSGFERYQPKGSELLENTSFAGQAASWNISGPAGSVVVEEGGAIRLHSVDPTQNISVTQRVADPGRFRLLRLSADLRTEKVVPGEKGWETARLILSSHDGKGQWLPVPHQVARLTGTTPWRHYAEVFEVSARADQVRATAQLSRARGTLWVRNLSLRQVIERPLYGYLRAGGFGLWGVFLAWLLAPYALRRGGPVGKGLMLMVVVAILWGTLMPGSLKMRLLAEGKSLAHDIAEAVSPPVAPAVTEPPTGFRFDVGKLGHLGLFALLAMVLAAAFPRESHKILMLDLMLLAGATEQLQVFIEGRTPMMLDFGIDTVGVFLGLGLWAGIGCRRNGKTQKNGQNLRERANRTQMDADERG